MRWKSTTAILPFCPEQNTLEQRWTGHSCITETLNHFAFCKKLTLHPAINDALRIVTGCLCPTPADNLPTLAGIQPAELCCNGATLSLAGHGTSTPAPLSVHLSIEYKCMAPQIETPIDTCHTITHQYIWQHTLGALGGSPMRCGIGRQPYKTCIFIPSTGTYPHRVTLTRRAWVWLNHLRTSVRCFRSCLYIWGMASSAACECGAEEQTVDHVVL